MKTSQITWKLRYKILSKQEFFKLVWRSYHKKIQYYLGQVISSETSELEDHVQEIMLKIYNNYSGFNTKYSLNTWIYSITRNYCIDILKAKKYPHKIIEENHPDTYRNNPEQQVIELEQAKVISDALNNLTSLEKEIAYLHYYEDISYAEISKIVKINKNTIKSKMQKIKKILKEELKRIR